MSGYKIFPSTRFKKDYKKILGKEKEIRAVQATITLLSQGGHVAIPKKMRPHKLVGQYKGCWECHVPDQLLIWEQTEEPKDIILNRLGSHSELF